MVPDISSPGRYEAIVMHDPSMINPNAIEPGQVREFFHSSSVHVSPEYNQLEPDNPKCYEDSAYPALPTANTGGRSCSVRG